MPKDSTESSGSRYLKDIITESDSDSEIFVDSLYTSSEDVTSPKASKMETGKRNAEGQQTEVTWYEALSFGDVYGPQEKHILDQYTFGSLVHGLLRAGREEEALAKVNSMKQIGINPTVHVYTSLIVHSFRKRDLSKALETLEMMKRDGCQPTTVTYSAIVRGYMDMEKISEAWDVFNQMSANGPLPDFRSYSMFITFLCKTGRSEEALVLISDMLDSGIIPSDVNYRTVFFGLNWEGKNHLAQNVVRKKVVLKKEVNCRHESMGLRLHCSQYSQRNLVYLLFAPVYVVFGICQTIYLPYISL